MGLDMNLYREVILTDSMKLVGRKGEAVEKIINEGEKDECSKVRPIIHNSVCYWRKFNALHKYFNDHFNNNDNDNCVDMYMGIDDLRKLLLNLKDLRKQIKQDKDGNVINKEVCEEVLPTQAGFFFGGTEYDEYYVEDIDYTIKKLSGIIEDHEKLVEAGVDEYDISYYYRAWY